MILNHWILRIKTLYFSFSVNKAPKRRAPKKIVPVETEDAALLKNNLSDFQEDQVRKKNE